MNENIDGITDLQDWTTRQGCWLPVYSMCFVYEIQRLNCNNTILKEAEPKSSWSIILDGNKGKAINFDTILTHFLTLTSITGAYFVWIHYHACQFKTVSASEVLSDVTKRCQATTEYFVKR